MKAFLNRFNRGLSKEPKDKDKDKDKDREKDREKDKSDTNTLSSSANSPHATPPSREKKELSQLPPLPGWPPRPEDRHSLLPPQIQTSSSTGTTGTTSTTGTTTGTPSSLNSIKPLPDLSARPLPPIEEPNDADNDSGVGLPPSSPIPHILDPSEPPAKSAARKAAETAASSEIQKKVAFISPPPTPSGPSTSQPLPDVSTSPIISGSPPQASAAVPLKTTVSRFQAAHGKDTRASTSTAASSSRTDLTSKPTTTTTPPSLTPLSVQSNKAPSTRTAVSPYPASLRSGTPYSQMSYTSTRILAASSWSEGAEDDLVSNLGPRERTRQEVLWEIVASEERYVVIFLAVHLSALA